ncbi:uncharacterized membrane protein (DUF485 family) [Mucilaginibacter lappiensis]|jgi:uncharacterized membrane protein (DUF485 family)
MPFNFNKEQKSPKKRFLFILGTVTFVCFVVLGIMIAFWEQLPIQLPKYQRYLFGAFVIAYSILRFSRLFKKDQYED